MSTPCILHSRRPSEGGATLLEILIAMTVVTVGMLGYFTLHIHALQLNGSAAIQMEAMNIAVSTMDMLVAMPYSTSAPLTQEYTADPGNPVDDLAGPLDAVNAFGTRDGGQGPVRYFRSYNVEELTPDEQPTAVGQTIPESSANQLLITVRVRYPAEDGRCPDCSSAHQQGWKAVTTYTKRTLSAY